MEKQHRGVESWTESQDECVFAWQWGREIKNEKICHTTIAE